MEKCDAGNRRHVEEVDGDDSSARRHVGLPVPQRSDTLRRDLAPAARRRAKVDYFGAGPEEAKLVVHFCKLVGRAGAQPLPLGARHVGIVELALQPSL